MLKWSTSGTDKFNKPSRLFHKTSLTVLRHMLPSLLFSLFPFPLLLPSLWLMHLVASQIAVYILMVFTSHSRAAKTCGLTFITVANAANPSLHDFNLSVLASRQELVYFY